MTHINDVEENINIKCVARPKLPYCMTSESTYGHMD